MRTYLYVGAVGPEADVRSIDARLAMPGSEVRPMLGQHTGKWRWRTGCQPVETGADDSLTAFLRDNWSSLVLLKEYESLYLTLEIVSEREGSNDVPVGYAVSAEAIRLIAALGADVDIDVIWYAST